MSLAGQDSRQFKIVFGFDSPPADRRTCRCSVTLLRAFTKFAFNILADSMHLAIRQLNGFGSGSLLRAILSEARPHGDSLANVVGKIFSLGSAPFQSGKRNGFKSPRGHVAAGILYIQVKISVRILPFKTRKRPREIHAFVRIELGRKRVMSGCGNCGGKQTKSRHQNTGESALHEYLLERKSGQNLFPIAWDMLDVPYQDRKS